MYITILDYSVGEVTIIKISEEEILDKLLKSKIINSPDNKYVDYELIEMYLFEYRDFKESEISYMVSYNCKVKYE